MRTALRELGFFECYHMHNVISGDESDVEQWERAIRAKYCGEGDPFTRRDWDKLLGTSQACCDLPAALFGVELAEAYPEAKVVILNRDPEAWYESVIHTTDAAMSSNGLWLMANILHASLWSREMRARARFFHAMSKHALGFHAATEKDKALAWFKAQYDEFRARIPAERCVEMTIKDGWAPLCKHLGVPVPTVVDEATGRLVEAPFPRTNDREFFQQHSSRLRARWTDHANTNFFAVVGRAALLAAAGYASYSLWKTRLSGRP